MDSQSLTWQQTLAQAFTHIDDLCRHLKLNSSQLELLSDEKNFPLLVPRGFANLMQVGNPNDPLLRQVLPLQAEMLNFPGYSQDPVGDLAAVASAGLIHKYHGRALMIVTGACAIHCRYCFRRNFPYGEQQLSKQKLQQAIDYLNCHTEINELILSGGDPLLFNDDKLAALLAKLHTVPHLQRIRLHTRVPVVLPERMTPTLLDIFSTSKLQLVMVIHANHGNELSAELNKVCVELKKRNITLLNQSVLLKGVNDDEKTLYQLSEKLFSFGILPYYLHSLDKANGTGHFAVPAQTELALIEYLRKHLPGYLVPKLVREQAGALFKLPLS
ncbi:EF-P beta-lysylation protein EpmB [Methylomonas sp. AM2-LC]|uniref:EF-P beta-lysylation protein EpmB n=1 Tax=Methylomonas sp. AM2-LC TaxID=3153301 RepID=UPI003265A8FC